jgi:nitrile hydratase
VSELGSHHGHPHEQDAHDPAPRPPESTYANRVRAVEALLIEKGVLTAEEIAHQQLVMSRRTPETGARMVARAWTDPGYRALLHHDFPRAAAAVGVDASGIVRFEVFENGPDVHHMVVCTLCSCYPRAIIGNPPDWYKSAPYRSRAVSEPRAVLAEFGLQIPPKVRVEVHDSSADLRYMVVPARPAGTEQLTEDELTALVTRDCLIGVAVPTYEPESA